MQLNHSTKTSTLNRTLGISLAAFSMFVVGYTASRVLLTQTASNTRVIESVTPHQATMWNALSR